ncbi:MAG: HDIG domain-containing protein [Chloroflexi bacterium]|nr:HDIG domain-containing protein [Chloroflexota bacterium]
MDRDEALQLVKDNAANANLVKHMLATEAMMRALARHFGEDEEKWGLAGLLHDVDYETTKDDFSKHGLVASQMLLERGVGEDIARAVKVHNETLGERETLMEKALFSIEGLSGLITAAALVHPQRKLAPLDVPFLIKRMGERSFARSVNRDHIRMCTGFGISLEKFAGIGLKAMQEISDQLGL